ncbi:MAG: hypothetical protein DRN06_02630 [Thermoprotei archaeon]|nr:MAG: hypothetical protein DRN06_02630 [Thermoprotei archaeon]
MKSRGVILAVTLLLLAIAMLSISVKADENRFEVKDAYWSSYTQGSTSYFSVVLSYKGEYPASDLEATLTPGPASTGGSNTDSYSEEVEAGQLVLFTFTLNTPLNPEVPSYDAELRVSYEAGGESKEESLTVPITLYGLPTLTLSATPSELKKGTVTEVELVVKNEGTGAARLINLIASSATPYLTVVEGSASLIGVLSPSSSSSVSLKLHVQSLALDSVALTVTATYLDQFGNAYASTYTLGFTVEPMPPVQLSLSLDPSVIVPDDVNYVKLIVENTGFLEASNISITLTPAQGLVILGSNYLTFDFIEAGGRVEAPLAIYAPPTLYGATVLSASLSYRDGEGRSYTYLASLGLEVGGEAEFIALRSSYVPPSVFPGDEGVELKVALANIGSYAAEDVEVRLVTPEGITPTYAGSDEVNLGTLPIGEYREISFYVDLDEELEPDRYNLTLTVSYDGGMQNLTLPLEVSRKARFEILEAYTEPTVLKQDERGVRVVLLLRNVEDVEAEQVRVRLLGSTFSGTTVSFLGTMEGSSTATASFEVDVSPTAPIGQVDVELQVLWVQRGRTLTQNLWMDVYIERGGFLINMDWFWEAPLYMKLIYATVFILAATVVAVVVKRKVRAQP